MEPSSLRQLMRREPISSFVAMADINGDGIPDIIVANWGGTVSVLGGKGDGTFFAAANYTAGNSPYALAVGDFNGDGNVDIAVANNADNTVCCSSVQVPGFLPPVPSSRRRCPEAIVAGDLMATELSTWHRRQQRRDRAFRLRKCELPAASHLSCRRNPYCIAVGDFNGDGKPDLAVANLDGGNVSILIGNGNGTSQFPDQLPRRPNSECVVAAI